MTSNPKDPAIIEAVHEGEEASVKKPGTYVFAAFTAGTRATVRLNDTKASQFDFQTVS